MIQPGISLEALVASRIDDLRRERRWRWRSSTPNQAPPTVEASAPGAGTRRAHDERCGPLGACCPPGFAVAVGGE
jgi:hypothetical protein